MVVRKNSFERNYISWENTEDVNINYWAFGNDGEERVNKFVWKVPYTLADVYGETWWNCPVVLIGGTGIESTFNTAIKLINETGAIRIVSDDDLNGTVTVYSLSGAKLYTHNGQINNTIVELPAGVYVVRIISAEGVMTSKAVVK